MISFNHGDVTAEAERWRGLAAPYETPISAHSLSLMEVIDVHFLIVDMFYKTSGGLGGIGPKDLGLLSSAISRQDICFDNIEKWHSLEDKVATLIYGIVLNHPFHDANKRTAFLSALFHLQKNGKYIRVTAKQFEDFLVSVAEKSFRKLDKFRKDFEGHEDADVRYISHYIRSITRAVDKKDYTITFRELDRVLKRFNFCLSNTHGNYVDVCFIDGEKSGDKVCQIGFPSWSKQVTRQGMKTIRQATGLSVLNGIDSQVFFKDVEPVSQLLAKYYEPLLRLADR